MSLRWLAPGVLEMIHNLMGREDALMALSEEPEARRELCAYIAEAKLACIVNVKKF